MIKTIKKKSNKKGMYEVFLKLISLTKFFSKELLLNELHKV